MEFVRPQEPVGLLLSTTPAKSATIITPYYLKWGKKKLPISTMGMHHTRKEGDKKLHVFGFACEGMDLTVELDPETLRATLTEVAYAHH